MASFSLNRWRPRASSNSKSRAELDGDSSSISVTPISNKTDVSASLVKVCFIAAVGVGLGLLAASARNPNSLQRFLHTLWEGETQGDRQIRRAKKAIDDLEKRIAEAEQEERNIDAARDAARASAEEGAAGVTPLHERRIRLEKNLAALSMQIDDVFKLVDGIEGDEVIIAARRQQAKRLVSLGDRADVAIRRLGPF